VRSDLKAPRECQEILPPNSRAGQHLHSHCTTMAATKQCIRTARPLRRLTAPTRTKDITLPAFLVPAFALPKVHAPFSTSSRYQSKIGRAPLSLPPDVTFRIFDSAPVKQTRAISRSEPSRRVEVEGPLGKMSLDIPPFINIVENGEERTYGLSILDANDKKQKAMWGTNESLHNILEYANGWVQERHGHICKITY
jgi:large subunit ribosomal protein L6